MFLLQAAVRGTFSHSSLMSHGSRLPTPIIVLSQDHVYTYFLPLTVAKSITGAQEIVGKLLYSMQGLELSINQ